MTSNSGDALPQRQVARRSKLRYSERALEPEQCFSTKEMYRLGRPGLFDERTGLKHRLRDFEAQIPRRLPAQHHVALRADVAFPAALALLGGRIAGIAFE